MSLKTDSNLSVVWSAILAGRPSELAHIARSPTSGPDVSGQLLHRFETGGIATGRITRQNAPAILVRGLQQVVAEWVSGARRNSDARFLNAALKVIDWLNPEDTAGDLTVLIEDCLAEVVQWSRSQVPPAPRDRFVRTIPFEHPLDPTRIVVLSGERSAGFERLLGELGRRGLSPGGVVAYGGERWGPGPWYPPLLSADSPVGPVSEPASLIAARAGLACQTVESGNWSEVASTLVSMEADLVVLTGMGMVPEAVWAPPKLGTINAHNGSLPDYRGMDAVAWAYLNNDPVVCSVHQVQSGADTGGVITEQQIEQPWSLPDLRSRIKSTQSQLLCDFIARATSQRFMTVKIPTVEGSQFYRMHKRLRRILDEKYLRPNLVTSI